MQKKLLVVPSCPIEVRHATGGRRRRSLSLFAVSQNGIKDKSITLVRKQSGSKDFAEAIIAKATLRSCDVVAVGSKLSSSMDFVERILGRRIPVLLLVSPAVAWLRDENHPLPSSNALRHISDAEFSWRQVKDPSAGTILNYGIRDLGKIRVCGHDLRLFAIKKGPGKVAQRECQLVLTSRSRFGVASILEAVLWIKCIRRIFARKTSAEIPRKKEAVVPAWQLSPRMNHSHAAELDRILIARVAIPKRRGGTNGTVRKQNVVELFAGAGGLGIGFLLSRSTKSIYNIIYSAELDPVSLETLRRNHTHLSNVGIWRNRSLEGSAVGVDLRSTAAMDALRQRIRKHGNADIVIGGPPCQGFSTANRNSGSPANPNNVHLETFVNYIEVLRPRLFVMENVQGILWTQRSTAAGNGRSLVARAVQRLKQLGYICFPKLLDAVWYGVPQYRTRFFLIGIREDLGYSEKDFGSWGPFPTPTHGPSLKRKYVTVGEAIGDLPVITNGATDPSRSYRERKSRDCFLAYMREGADQNIITEHITSRHADYVLERFSRISEGGNWESIAEMLSNYANPSRTHSNIYKRLSWTEPSITIGHYRKSMIVHPKQHRGLSLREACRLQSFPDWFEFVGSIDGRSSGLSIKQQQLANAVAPLVSRAIAEVLAAL